MDPISIALSVASLVKGFMDQGAAKSAASKNAAQQSQNMQFQLQNLANALSEARTTGAQRTAAASALREDQFGNTTYYDPNQGRMVTTYTPLQKDIIGRGQERQYSAQARGAQAGEDYNRLRGEYLYRQPEDENQIRSEIMNLLSQARGTSEQQINQLYNRFNMRTQGNIVQLTPNETGPSYGQDLAEMLLKARGSALDESIKRKQAHQSEYLPALKQFEDTANYVAPVDPTGSGIVSQATQGLSDVQSSYGDLSKLIAQIYGQGGQATNTASGLMNTAAAGEVKAAGSGPSVSDFMKIATLLQPKPEKTTGTLGNTKGATYSGSNGGSGIGDWDRRFNFGPTVNASGRGTGTDAAPIGGPSIADYLAAKEADPYNFTPQQSIDDRWPTF
jgi:hypothetical protein